MAKKKIIKKRILYRDFQEYLLEELQSPKLALLYLNEAFADEDQRVFCLH